MKKSEAEIEKVACSLSVPWSQSEKMQVKENVKVPNVFSQPQQQRSISASVCRYIKHAGVTSGGSIATAAVDLLHCLCILGGASEHGVPQVMQSEGERGRQVPSGLGVGSPDGAEHMDCCSALGKILQGSFQLQAIPHNPHTEIQALILEVRGDSLGRHSMFVTSIIKGKRAFLCLLRIFGVSGCRWRSLKRLNHALTAIINLYPFKMDLLRTQEHQLVSFSQWSLQQMLQGCRCRRISLNAHKHLPKKRRAPGSTQNFFPVDDAVILNLFSF